MTEPTPNPPEPGADTGGRVRGPLRWGAIALGVAVDVGATQLCVTALSMVVGIRATIRQPPSSLEPAVAQTAWQLGWSEKDAEEACPWAGSRQAVTLQEEHEAALAIVERSEGNLSLIHTNIEDALESSVWRWLGDLPRDLSDEGHHADAVTLNERLAAVWRDEQLVYDLPLLLARSGDRQRALSLVESNLAEFPDEPNMLLPAGQALETLGENDRAESAYRDALTWVGFETSLRDEIVTTHIALLEREGRADAAEELRQSERKAQRAVEEERDRSMGLLPPTIRRTKPKTGRNEPCPCGSGKKYKKCCGRGQ